MKKKKLKKTITASNGLTKLLLIENGLMVIKKGLINTEEPNR